MEERLYRYRSDHDLARCGRVETGTYISQWYRGLGAGMEWLRLSLDAPAGAAVQIYVQDGEPEGPGGEGESVLARAADDLLLYGVKGRYLSFSVTPAQGLAGYELSFPARSIDALLPAVLQNDATLRALLGVYQSLYTDLNQDTAAFPRRLDPLGDDPLPGLPMWLGAERWVRPGLPVGALLAAAPRLNRLRGTRRGLELLLELATGCPCAVVERTRRDAEPQSAQAREERRRLYGGGVTVLVPAQVPEGAVRGLGDILADFIPLGVSYTLVHLRDGAGMDEHSYLDENAQVSAPPAGGMDSGADDTLTME